MITELKIRFLPPDLTLVQSEMVVLGVLGYSRTQHAGFDDEGILSVSGHRHLGELDYELFKLINQYCKQIIYNIIQPNTTIIISLTRAGL